MLSPFRMVCRDFILPESANYVYFFPFFFLRNLFYLIEYILDIGLYCAIHFLERRFIYTTIKTELLVGMTQIFGPVEEAVERVQCPAVILQRQKHIILIKAKDFGNIIQIYNILHSAENLICR